MDLSLKALQYPLPEDLRKLIAYGDFTGVERLIDERIADERTAPAIKERLALEKILLKRVRQSYPFDRIQALAEMDKNFNNVTETDLSNLVEEDAADWFFIDGKLHLKDDFINNIVKTRKKWEDRLKPGAHFEDKEGNFSMLDKMIARMEAKGQTKVNLTVEMSLQVKEEAYKEGKRLQVHLPVPVEYRQVRNLKIDLIEPEPVHIGRPQYPQRTVCFEGSFPQDQVFKVRFSFENHSFYKQPQADQVASFNPNFYTQEETPHIIFTPFIKQVAKDIVGDSKNPLVMARKIYDFITTHIIYSYVRPYFTITNIPHYCLTSRKGDCGILALTFITLCRAVGIPARWQGGLYANPLSIGNHDWAEYFVEPYGWLFADCSFGGAAYRAGNEKRWNFYSANLEPYRVPFSSAFQYPLYPEKHFLRNDPYDNQIGEAEYEDGFLFQEDLIQEEKLISLKEIE